MMAIKMKFILLAVFMGIVSGNPAIKQQSSTFWKGTPLDGMIEEMRSNCDSGSDSVSCIKVKIMKFLDTIFKKDNFHLTDDVEIRSNGYVNTLNEARSQNDLVANIEGYIQSHDVTFNMPFADTKVTVSPRNLENNELNLNIKLPSDEGRGRKHKLKRIAVPIMVFILLKAITLIPLAIGVLGLKAWNALQLGFLSFLVSVGLAIFQLCKKIAVDHHHPAITAHGPWDGRSFTNAQPIPDFDAQNLAYNAYS